MGRFVYLGRWWDVHTEKKPTTGQDVATEAPPPLLLPPSPPLPLLLLLLLPPSSSFLHLPPPSLLPDQRQGPGSTRTDGRTGARRLASGPGRGRAGRTGPDAQGQGRAGGAAPPSRATGAHRRGLRGCGGAWRGGCGGAPAGPRRRLGLRERAGAACWGAGRGGCGGARRCGGCGWRAALRGLRGRTARAVGTRWRWAGERCGGARQAAAAEGAGGGGVAHGRGGLAGLGWGGRLGLDKACWAFFFKSSPSVPCPGTRERASSPSAREGTRGRIFVFFVFFTSFFL